MERPVNHLFETRIKVDLTLIHISRLPNTNGSQVVLGSLDPFLNDVILLGKRAFLELGFGLTMQKTTHSGKNGLVNPFAVFHAVRGELNPFEVYLLFSGP